MLDRHQPGDFTADRRVLVLIGVALIVGSLGTGAAWVLLKLIALTTNLVWLEHFGFGPASPAQAAPSPRAKAWLPVSPGRVKAKTVRPSCTATWAMMWASESLGGSGPAAGALEMAADAGGGPKVW